jgi:hypothetical protein
MNSGELRTFGSPGTIPNYQHVAVSNPQAGRWTVKILWGGADQDIALPQPTPGTFTGNLSFKVSGQNWVTSSASKSVTIPAHAGRSVPLKVAFPAAPGDHPESVQFTTTSQDGNNDTTLLTYRQAGTHARTPYVPATGSSSRVSTSGRISARPAV